MTSLALAAITGRSRSRRWGTKKPARALSLAALLLPFAAQASSLINPIHAEYSAYSAAQLTFNNFDYRQQGPFEKGNRCDCGTLDSFGNGSGGYNNAFADIGYMESPNQISFAMATGSFYGEQVQGMPVYGHQTDNQGDLSIKGEVMVKVGNELNIASASHVGSKANWSYRFYTLTDVDFTFDYRYVLGGTPMPPQLLIDGVSSLDPNLPTGSYLTHFSAGSVHTVAFQNSLALSNLCCRNVDQFANMDFQARWTITETTPIPQVPEPTTAALLLPGLGLVAWVRRRRQNGAHAA